MNHHLPMQQTISDATVQLRLLLAGMAMLVVPAADAIEYVCPNCPQMAQDVAALIPDSAITTRAVASGSWSAAATWQDGQVPGINAVVLIPSGISITYDLDSTTRIKCIRNMGTLSFAIDRDTRLLVDTFLNQPTGVLNIGSAGAPLQADKVCRIIFTGDVINQNNDPKKLGKGLISNGVANIFGGPKLAHTSLAGDAMAGDRSITLAETPVGWRVGDKIVVGGTWGHEHDYDIAQNRVKDATNNRFHDEVLTITGINGTVISFSNDDITSGDAARLRFAHRRPADVPAVYALKIPVANLTRNIRFESEVGRNGEYWRRGHVMFMHAPTVSVKYAAFRDLGRTNKDQLLDDATLDQAVVIGTTSIRVKQGIGSTNTGFLQESGQINRPVVILGGMTHTVLNETEVSDQVVTLQISPAAIATIPAGTVVTINGGSHGFNDANGNLAGTGRYAGSAYPGGPNVRGCYSLHIHHMRLDQTVPLEGNVVVGSPGWGIAHHFANVDLVDNVVFDVFGCGIVAESGREVGIWRRNLVIKTTGNLDGSYNPTPISRTSRFDLGFEGEGFMVYGAGQSLELVDNIAVSNSGAGVIYQHNRGSGEAREFDDFEVRYMKDTELRDRLLAAGVTTMDLKFVPLYRFSGQVVINSLVGWWSYGHQTINGIHHVNAGDTIPYFKRSRIDGFRFWNLGWYSAGISLAYAGRIEFSDGLLHGAPGNAGIGCYGNSASRSLVFRNVRFQGFERGGLRVPGSARVPQAVITSELHDCVFDRIGGSVFDEFESTPTPNGYRFPDYFVMSRTAFTDTPASTPPQPAFSATQLGGQALLLDAGASSDPDVSGSPQDSSRAIVAYGWDLDVDGVIDRWGRQIEHRFPQTGSRVVRLWVWDRQGRNAAVQQNVDVRAGAYVNPVRDQDFSSATAISYDPTPWDQYAQFSSALAGFGWTARRDGNLGWSVRDGAAAALAGFSDQRFGQVIRDNSIRRGPLTFSLRFRNAGTSIGTATVRLWGIDGEFEFDMKNVRSFGLYPFTRCVKLIEQNMSITDGTFRTITANTDAGEGFQYLLIQLDANGTSIAIDDVSITGPAPNAAPIITAGPNANPGTVSGKSTALAVTAVDDGGETALTYTWSSSSPGAVSFSANGNNAAKATTASFAKAGAFQIAVVVRDAGGLTATRSVAVTVKQTVTSYAVSPSIVTVAPGSTQQFTAVLSDQFGNPMGDAVMAQIPNWLVSGGGTISLTGLFTAGIEPGGPFTVTAQASGLSGTAQVHVQTTVDSIPPKLEVTAATIGVSAPRAKTVTIGGQPATLVNGQWWREVTLAPGTNRIAVQASDGTLSSTTIVEVQR